MSAHTPGPWLVSVSRDFVDSKAHLIAQSLAPSAAARHANTQLIAAAPVMLETLRECVEAVEACLPAGDEEVGLPEFPSLKLSEIWNRRERARAVLDAIRKATGGAP